MTAEESYQLNIDNIESNRLYIFIKFNLLKNIFKYPYDLP